MKMDKEKILQSVNKALEYQFQGSYTWRDMIGDTDLTIEEKEWAIDNVSYRAHII